METIEIDPRVDMSAPADELPLTTDELAEIAKKVAARQRPAKRTIVRAGITKHKGQKADKAKRTQAKLSRKINR